MTVCIALEVNDQATRVLELLNKHLQILNTLFQVVLKRTQGDRGLQCTGYMLNLIPPTERGRSTRVCQI